MEIPWKIHGIDGITMELWRNWDGMSPWQNSDEKSVGNQSRFCCVFHVPSVLGLNWLFHPGRLRDDRLQKKIDCESSSERRKVLGCLKCKYENCIFSDAFHVYLVRPKCLNTVLHTFIANFNQNAYMHEQTTKGFGMHTSPDYCILFLDM